MTITEQVFTTDTELAAWLNEEGSTAWWVGDSAADWNSDYDQLAVYTPEPSDMFAVEALLKALITGPLRGEWWDGCMTVLIDNHCYFFDIDTTKIGRDDVPDAWNEYKHWLVEGSPVRTTDRAGAGTKGTRKHQGLGSIFLAWR